MASHHLLHVPPSGGRPMIDSDPMRKAVSVIGMRRPMPSSSLTSVLCAATMIAPAQKNRVILPAACMAICRPPPITAVDVAIAAPKNDIGKLADCGVGQSRLEVVLGQRHHRRRDQAERRHRRQPVAGAGAGQRVDPEHVDNDLQHREHAGLDHPRPRAGVRSPASVPPSPPAARSGRASAPPCRCRT